MSWLCIRVLNHNLQRSKQSELLSGVNPKPETTCTQVTSDDPLPPIVDLYTSSGWGVEKKLLQTRTFHTHHLMVVVVEVVNVVVIIVDKQWTWSNGQSVFIGKYRYPWDTLGSSGGTRNASAHTVELKKPCNSSEGNLLIKIRQITRRMR